MAAIVARHRAMEEAAFDAQARQVQRERERESKREGGERNRDS